jgi:hypothetical protein
MELTVAPGVIVEAEVAVDPGHDYHSRIYPDLLRRSNRVLNPHDHKLLQSAAETARARAYVLYRFRCAPWRGPADEVCAELP